MSKSLRSIADQKEKLAIITRRIREETKGLGYWSAVGARERAGKVKKEEIK